MRKNTSPLQSLLPVSLALACLLGLATRASALETFCVVKITDMDKRVEHKIMSPEEFKELETQVKAEASLFPKAEELVKKEWKADEGNKSTPFPGRLGPRKVEVVTRESSSERADKKLESLAASEERRQNPPRRSGKMSDAEKKQADIKADKERDLQKACDAVKAKIGELVAKAAEAKIKPDEATPKAEEAAPESGAPL